MDEETKKILEGLELRISRLENQKENSPSEQRSKESTIIWRGDIPEFTRILPSNNRLAQQNAAILLLMKNIREKGEISTTSNKISRYLHLASVDTNNIKYAFNSLRNAKPKLINSKPNKRELFLTQEGEFEAKKLERELLVK